MTKRGKKERKRKKERTNHSMKIYMVSLFHRATINSANAKTHTVVHQSSTFIYIPNFFEIGKKNFLWMD